MLRNISEKEVRQTDREMTEEIQKRQTIQESRAVARKPRDAATVIFGLKFADNIHYKFKSSQASKARRQGSKRTGTKQNLTQNGHSRSRALESVERR